MYARNFFAELLYQMIGFFLSHMSPHLLQHRITDMLKGDIHIPAHIRTLTHDSE